VRFDAKGNPGSVERLGVALEPKEAYELRGDGSGGCEDPLMAYTAHSVNGPRIALATSKDLVHWQRLGLATFSPYRGIKFEGASVFPVAIPCPSGKPSIAILHQPLFPGTRPEESVRKHPARAVDLHHESIWISYCPMDPGGNLKACHFESHHRLVAPVERWEWLKIG
jgi:hypothetical protein